MKLFERLLDTDVKADILTLFHNHATLEETAEQLAKRTGRNPAEVHSELEDLVELGILKKTELYSFGTERDKEIQDAISKQLALGEALGPGGDMEHEVGSQIPKMSVGVEILDKLLPDGLPSTCTVVFLSDPGAGEENLLAHLVSRQIEFGKPVLYVTLDNFPPNIRQSVRTHVTKENVDWSALMFVDCYSKTVGVESEEPNVVDPENLSGISIALSEVMTKSAISMIVLDSFNTLIRKRGAHSAMEFMRVLVAKTRQAKCISILTMNRKAFPLAIMASAQDVADGVIEFKLEEEAQRAALSLRILKMIGTRHSTSWERYMISDDGELVPYDGTGP
jgi:KaiC/GvpD/RAD55 family RecA-like ATPase